MNRNISEKTRDHASKILTAVDKDYTPQPLTLQPEVCSLVSDLC